MQSPRNLELQNKHMIPKLMYRALYRDYELLERSNVQYMALQQMQDHKRQHFTFRSYELET